MTSTIEEARKEDGLKRVDGPQNSWEIEKERSSTIGVGVGFSKGSVERNDRRLAPDGERDHEQETLPSISIRECIKERKGRNFDHDIETEKGGMDEILHVRGGEESSVSQPNLDRINRVLASDGVRVRGDRKSQPSKGMGQERVEGSRKRQDSPTVLDRGKVRDDQERERRFFNIEVKTGCSSSKTFLDPKDLYHQRTSTPRSKRRRLEKDVAKYGLEKSNTTSNYSDYFEGESRYEEESDSEDCWEPREGKCSSDSDSESMMEEVSRSSTDSAEESDSPSSFSRSKSGSEDKRKGKVKRSPIPSNPLRGPKPGSAESRILSISGPPPEEWRDRHDKLTSLDAVYIFERVFINFENWQGRDGKNRYAVLEDVVGVEKRSPFGPGEALRTRILLWMNRVLVWIRDSGQTKGGGGKATKGRATNQGQVNKLDAEKMALIFQEIWRVFKPEKGSDAASTRAPNWMEMADARRLKCDKEQGKSSGNERMRQYADGWRKKVISAILDGRLL
ncbi:hypothetical protein IE53DRAFT_366953 [Violaceomyces palustris]|uniref:Uncharacterized protein n=1 Tax=Violaceomyces palustris TaxID=1673888 RepID=A0ACD0P3L7_9BASI|nr:hypothetical protein IE53DRAFT_366953 [Violaceomyces palustris]